MISEAVKKQKHVEKLIEQAEKTGDFGIIEVYEDVDVSYYLDEQDDLDEEPFAEDICKIVYKKR